MINFAGVYSDGPFSSAIGATDAGLFRHCMHVRLLSSVDLSAKVREHRD